jgi:hypothetical protein
MNLHGSMDPGAKESYKGSEGTRPKPTSKRSIASSTDLSNRFSVLQDHAAGGSGGATGGRDDVQAALERKSGLVTADDVGVARRHVKAMVNENETGAHTQKDRQALKALKPLMSLSEWHKLSSAKQRKKMRKLSARQEKEELLRAVRLSYFAMRLLPVSLRLLAFIDCLFIAFALLEKRSSPPLFLISCPRGRTHSCSVFMHSHLASWFGVLAACMSATAGRSQPRRGQT